MANLFDVFKQNPKKMPGQGLASPDFDYEAQHLQYDTLNRQYADALDTYAPRFAQNRVNSVRATLPGVTSAYLQSIRESDPEAAALLDRLTQTASNDLTLDNRLDQNQRMRLEQDARKAGAARGMGYGPTDMYAEMLAKLGYGDQLRDKRRAAAMNLAGYRQSMAQRPADVAIQSEFSQSPEQNLFSSLMATYGANQENARTQAELETKIGMDQAEKWNNWFRLGAGAMACWAAREVFGADDIRWLEFRHWMLNRAGEKFRAWYLRYGPQWAERLRSNPTAKAVVRRWMERKINYGRLV